MYKWKGTWKYNPNVLVNNSTLKITFPQLTADLEKATTMHRKQQHYISDTAVFDHLSGHMDAAEFFSGYCSTLLPSNWRTYIISICCHLWANKVTEDEVTWCEAPWASFRHSKEDEPIIRWYSECNHIKENTTPLHWRYFPEAIPASNWLLLIAVWANDWHLLISTLVHGQF